MTHLSPRAIEAGARAAFDALPLTQGDFDDLSEYGKNNMRDVVRAILTALEAEGMVVVPKAALSYAQQMANICFNLKQSSALEPSTRKSMEETQTGFDRAMAAQGGVDAGQ